MFLETKNYCKIFKFFKNFNYLESKSKFNSLDEFVDSFESETQFKPKFDRSEPEIEISNDKSKPEPEPKTKLKDSKQSRQTTNKDKDKDKDKSSKKSSKKSKNQKGGSVSNTHEDKIVQLYNQDNDYSSDNDKVGYLDDDYVDIINLNDL